MIDNPKLRTLKEQLEAEIAKAERSAVADPQRFIGFDWWQMTPEEQSVFGIDPKRLPRMGVTWFCYEAVKLIADADTWDADLIRDARQEHPYWCDEATSQLEFADFAKEYAGLTFRESDAFYNKNRWRARSYSSFAALRSSAGMVADAGPGSRSLTPEPPPFAGLTMMRPRLGRGGCAAGSSRRGHQSRQR